MVEDSQNGLCALEHPLLTWFLSGGLRWGVWGSDLVSWVGSVGPGYYCRFLLTMPHVLLAHPVARVCL